MSDEFLNSGSDDARRDIAEGRLRCFWGTRNPWADFCHELMRSRFGIEVVSTSCITTEELDKYRREYNSVIRTHVDDHFGQGAFDRAWEEVQQYRSQLYRRISEERRVD